MYYKKVYDKLNEKLEILTDFVWVRSQINGTFLGLSKF